MKTKNMMTTTEIDIFRATHGYNVRFRSVTFQFDKGHGNAYCGLCSSFCVKW